MVKSKRKDRGINSCRGQGESVTCSGVGGSNRTPRTVVLGSTHPRNFQPPPVLPYHGYRVKLVGG